LTYRTNACHNCLNNIILHLFFLRRYGYLLVFQMTDLQSLITLKDTYKKLCEAREFDDSLLDCHLVGTKSDEKLHDVTEVKIAEIAKELSCGYSIVSAKTGENISKPFLELVDKLYKQNQPPYLWKAHPKYDKPTIPPQKEQMENNVVKTVVTGICSICQRTTDPKDLAAPTNKKKNEDRSDFNRAAVEVSLNVFKEPNNKRITLDNSYSDDGIKETKPKEVPPYKAPPKTIYREETESSSEPQKKDLEKEEEKPIGSPTTKKRTTIKKINDSEEDQTKKKLIKKKINNEDSEDSSPKPKKQKRLNLFQNHN